MVKQNEPKIYANIDKVMLPGDFIAMKLIENSTTSIAALSESVFSDFQQNELSEDIFGYYGFASSFIPEIKNVFTEYGRISLTAAIALSLKEGIPVTYKTGDQPNNALSLNVVQPGKHQYDYDCETVIGFLRQYDLLNDFSLNIEVNHATLAGHTMHHEMQVAVDAGLPGSLDANRGDYLNGWDTGQFPNDINELTEYMLVLLQAGGFKGSGINVDAKIRRNSTDAADLLYAHIGGIDVFARALLTADTILQESGYKRK